MVFFYHDEDAWTYESVTLSSGTLLCMFSNTGEAVVQAIVFEGKIRTLFSAIASLTVGQSFSSPLELYAAVSNEDSANAWNSLFVRQLHESGKIFYRQLKYFRLENASMLDEYLHNLGQEVLYHDTDAWVKNMVMLPGGTLLCMFGTSGKIIAKAVVWEKKIRILSSLIAPKTVEQSFPALSGASNAASARNPVNGWYYWFARQFDDQGRVSYVQLDDFRLQINSTAPSSALLLGHEDSDSNGPDVDVMEDGEFVLFS